MKYFVLIMLLISLNACASPSDCQDPQTQSEMTNCAIKKLDNLEKEINKKIKYLSKTISDDKYFILANKSWEGYRDSHCASISNIYLGGSIYNYVITECKVNQSQVRLKALENDYKDTIDIITKGAP